MTGSEGPQSVIRGHRLGLAVILFAWVTWMPTAGPLTGTPRIIHHQSLEPNSILFEIPILRSCLEYKGQGLREMPDKTDPATLDSASVYFCRLFCGWHPCGHGSGFPFSVGRKARAEALRYAPRLGQLPTSLRKGCNGW